MLIIENYCDLLIDYAYNCMIFRFFIEKHLKNREMFRKTYLCLDEKEKIV
jgi:hypothetical protein